VPRSCSRARTTKPCASTQPTVCSECFSDANVSGEWTHFPGAAGQLGRMVEVLEGSP
jgi:hypothetical protein